MQETLKVYCLLQYDTNTQKPLFEYFKESLSLWSSSLTIIHVISQCNEGLSTKVIKTTPVTLNGPIKPINHPTWNWPKTKCASKRRRFLAYRINFYSLLCKLVGKSNTKQNWNLVCTLTLLWEYLYSSIGGYLIFMTYLIWFNV